MEFRVLGPFEVVGPCGPIKIGGPLPRAVLALLVLNVGRTVTSNRLIDEIWGDDPPQGAQHALEVHVAALRRVLGPGWIETRPNGYRLRSGGSEVDLARFESLVSDASRAFEHGEPRAAATALAAALDLWRGPALGDLAGGNAARSERARLDELRAFVLERRVDAELACGHHLEIVPALRGIIAEMPLREAFSARLMLALYRSGRQADALDVYHHAREILDRELGVEPGLELEALQRAILDHDPALNLVPGPRQFQSSAPDHMTDRVGRPIHLAPDGRHTRRTVTALIADVSGSTLAGESLDPESARLPLDRCLTEMQAVLERHGGTVERIVGEAVMAVFGLPVLHEDDALRAVRAAAEMRTAVGALSEILARDLGVRIEMRIGLNTDEVISGGGAGFAKFVTGDAVNIASRLEQAAAPGEIRLGERTFQLVRDAVEVSPAQSTDRNGNAEPLVAYRLHDVTGTEGHRRRFDVPLVGRVPELDALKQAFDRAVAGRSCQLFTVLGTAGVGKSRLVAEFTHAVRDRAKVVRGRCLPYGEGITYWPIAEIVRQAAGVEVGDSADIVRNRIDQFASGLPERAAIARGLVGIIGLDASASQQELLWAFRRALEHLADERPLVVVVEDLHWAEPTLLDLLESVADIARDSPMLIACPARPELLDDRPAWGGGKVNATTILLEPLTGASALQLIDSLVPVGALPAASRAWIADAAEGNPLYVEEFLGMLIEDGAPGGEGDAFAARDLASIGVPPTIQALLSARLDRLLPDERAVVERASVVGRTFDEASVVALCPPDARSDVPKNLISLSRKELIRRERSGLLRGDGFRFRHILIRDAAYERLPKAERAELHELLGGWLDLAAGDRRTEVEELVGYHLEQAVRHRDELAPVDDRTRDVARRAAQRLIAAGRRAFERTDIAAAVNLLSRAAALLDPADPARLAILPDLGRALDSHGRFEEARTCFAEALKRSEAAGDERALAHARVLMSVTGTAGAWRKHAGQDVSPADARQVADECVAIFERLGDDRGLALSWRLRAEASRMEGSSAGREAALVRALEHARRAGAHWEETSIVWDLSIDFFWGPTPVAEVIRRCNDILANAPDDRAIEMPMTHALAHMHARLGEFDLARSLAVRCREIAAESGQRYEAAVLSEVVGDVEMLAGEFDAAEQVLVEGNDWFASRGERHPILEANVSSARVASGRPVNVERLAAMAAEERGAPRALLEGARAAALAASGRFVEAERSARGAVDFFATTDFLTWHADTMLILGDVLRAAGRRAEADAAFQQAVDLFRRKGSLVGEWTAMARLAG